MIEDVIRALRLSARRHLPADIHPPLRERDLLADVSLQIPTCGDDGRSDELAADITLAEGRLLHSRNRTNRKPSNAWRAFAGTARREWSNDGLAWEARKARRLPGFR